jgi:hypothetical protein
MQFARLKVLRALRLLKSGHYSTAEQELLDLEARVQRMLSANPRLLKVDKLRPHIYEFFTLQVNNSVRTREYATIKKSLTDLLSRLELVAGTVSPTFANHQPNALVGEIRTHIHSRLEAVRLKPMTTTGAVIHYAADLRNHAAVNFHALISSGQRVLWTVDVDRFLSIGDPLGNKHSVVAAGKDVFGAGMAQLKIDKRMDTYLAMQEQLRRAGEYEEQAKNLPKEEKKTKEFLENASHFCGMAEEYRLALSGWVPPEGKIRSTITLDFDSGHYAPRGGWLESERVWKAAGYGVEWSTTSKFS